MTPTPVGMRCPECAGDRTRVASVRFGRSDTPYATYALMALNVIVFAAEVAGGGGAATLEGGGALVNDGGLFGPAISQGGEWYRIFTSGFLHAGPLHLFLNMFVLYILGGILEPAIGPVRFVGIYIVSLLAGSIGALLLTPDELTVGASGAVYGLMAATVLVARNRGVEQLASQIGIWIVINLVFTFSVPGISIGGHLGGLAGGAVAAMLIIAAEQRVGPRTRVLELAALVALSAVCFALALAVA
jgi:membrane associated rhomboid family serine protease